MKCPECKKNADKVYGELNLCEKCHNLLQDIFDILKKDPIMKKFYTNERAARIKMNNGSIISGIINIRSHDRLSDAVDDTTKSVLILYNATSALHDKGAVFIIPKTSIAYVEPIEKMKIMEDNE